MSNALTLLMMKKKNVSHILHLLLSIITAGLWIPIWIGMVAYVISHNSYIDEQIEDILEAEQHEAKNKGAGV